MNFQESVDRDMNFYVFARDLNKHLLDLNYNMVSTVNESSSIRIYKLPYYEDGSPYSFFVINYTEHVIDYRNIPENDTYWHALDFQLELITQSELDALKNMAIKIQEQLKKIKVENKIKELEKDFE
ncbi:MAG: hypothetical protein J6T74_06105 [Clostridia bacterium]|nr:hypothetical protein [Clostridia bacterium]